MRVIFLTNLFPLEKNLMSGIFINKRLEQYRMLGIDYIAIPVWLKGNLLVQLTRRLRRLVGKNFGNPVTNAFGVDYSLLECTNTPNLVFWEGLRRMSKAFEERSISIYAQQVAECIEKNFNLSAFDLVHAHGMFTPPAGLVAKILGERSSKPYVITLHGSDVNALLEKRKNIYIEVLESAQAVIFVSHALLQKAKSFGYSGKNAFVIPNGYDPTIFRPTDKGQVRKQLGIHSENHKYVGFVGNLIEVKRADKLVEIFDLVRKGYPKVKFIVVGDGYLRAKMEQVARKKGLEVLFTGRLDQSEVAKYMNAMDVMVLPSRNEGFGAVVIEAQVCGTCVVGSSTGGIPEAIGFEEYVVEEGPNFEERFAKRVVDVLQNGYDAQRLIERAQKYTWENIVKMEKEVYETVVARKQKKGKGV